MLGTGPLAASQLGLLPMEEQGGLLNGLMNPQNQAMLSMAASLLESGGPSLTPTSFGQSLGRAGMAGMNAYNQGLQQSVQNALLKRKDRKSTRLNSSHVKISYAVFCLKKKN